MIIYKLKNLLFRLIHPGFWIQIHPSDEYLDRILNRLMDCDAEVAVISELRCKIGGLHVWTGNYPYGYGSICDGGGFVPYSITRYRLRRYINRKHADAQLKKSGVHQLISREAE